MKKLFLVIISLCGAILLAGCPFEFETSVAAPKADSFDARLLGTWSWENEEGRSIFSVIRFNDAEYLIESLDLSTGGEMKREFYRGYMVTIGGQQFLQMNDLDPEADYFLVRVAIAGDAMTVRFVGDKGVPPELRKNTPKLIEYIEKNLEGAKLEGEDKPIVLQRGRAVATRVK